MSKLIEYDGMIGKYISKHESYGISNRHVTWSCDQQSCDINMEFESSILDSCIIQTSINKVKKDGPDTAPCKV